MRLLIYLLLALFCLLAWCSVFYGFAQLISDGQDKQDVIQNDSLKVQSDRIERKINIMLPEFYKAGYVYDFESEDYEVKL